jgi:hypothetical protein
MNMSTICNYTAYFHVHSHFVLEEKYAYKKHTAPIHTSLADVVFSQDLGFSALSIPLCTIVRPPLEDSESISVMEWSPGTAALGTNNIYNIKSLTKTMADELCVMIIALKLGDG